MHPRYFAKIRMLEDGSGVEWAVIPARFTSRSAAEAAAEEKYDYYGLSEVVVVREETTAEAWLDKTGRILIRSFCVAFGAIIAAAGYYFLLGAVPPIGAVPIGSLVLNMVLKMLIYGGLFLFSLFVARTNRTGF